MSIENRTQIATPDEEGRNNALKMFSSKPDSDNRDDLYEKSEMSTINEMSSKGKQDKELLKKAGDNMIREFKKKI